MRIEQRRRGSGCQRGRRWQACGGLRGGTGRGRLERRGEGWLRRLGRFGVSQGRCGRGRGQRRRRVFGLVGRADGDRGRHLDLGRFLRGQVRLDCVGLGWFGLNWRLGRLSDGARLESVGRFLDRLRFRDRGSVFRFCFHGGRPRDGRGRLGRCGARLLTWRIRGRSRFVLVVQTRCELDGLAGGCRRGAASAGGVSEGAREPMSAGDSIAGAGLRASPFALASSAPVAGGVAGAGSGGATARRDGVDWSRDEGGDGADSGFVAGTSVADAAGSDGNAGAGSSLATTVGASAGGSSGAVGPAGAGALSTGLTAPGSPEPLLAILSGLLVPPSLGVEAALFVPFFTAAADDLPVI